MAFDIKNLKIARSADSGSINWTAEVNEPSALAYVRVHFTAGTGTADLVLSRRPQRGDTVGVPWQTSFKTFHGRGNGADLSYSVPQEVLDRMLFDYQGGVNIAWTDPGTSKWGIEVGWIPWTD